MSHGVLLIRGHRSIMNREQDLCTKAGLFTQVRAWSKQKMIMRLLMAVVVTVSSLSAKEFHVKDYGAQGDGTSDDGPAIREADANGQFPFPIPGKWTEV